MLRECAEGIKEFIEKDPVLRDFGHLTVIVEDKASVSFELANALGQLGVAVMISVTGFDRVDRSPIIQGNLQIQISCYEHPELNRDDDSTMTAQGVSERLATILHYTRFPFFVGQMIFKNFSRDDTDDANIVRGNYEVNTKLGFEDEYFHPVENETPTE